MLSLQDNPDIARLSQDKASLSQDKKSKARLSPIKNPLLFRVSKI